MSDLSDQRRYYERMIDEIADAHREQLDQLKAENAKLKEERDHWRVEQVHAYGNWEEAHKRATELEAENAKLRELLQDYHRYEHEDCYSCRYIDECRADESGRCIAPMRLGERYHELGVEVEE